MELRLIFFLTVLVLSVDSTAIAQEPVTLPFQIPEGSELYADPAGFLIVKGAPEAVPHPDPYTPWREVPTSRLFQPLGWTGIPEAARAQRVAEGPYDFYDGSAVVGLAEFFPDKSGAFAFLQSIEGSTAVIPWGSTSTNVTCLAGVPVSGEIETRLGLQGNRGDGGSRFWGYPVRDQEGGLFFLGVENVWSTGDWFLGIPGSSEFYLQQIASTGASATIKVNGAPSSPGNLAVCRATADASLGVIVGEYGSVPTFWRFDADRLTSGTLTGMPTGVTHVAAAEHSGGEMVVLQEDGGVLQAWSSTSGLSILGSGTATQGEAGWFDDTGACHFYVGGLPIGDSCPLHIWRPAGGSWQVTNLCELAPGETLVRGAFDMTRFSELRVALHTRTTTSDKIRVLRFDAGIWSSEAVATSMPGFVFADLRAGSLSADDLLVVYRVLASDPSSEGAWKVYLESGGFQLLSADPVWRTYR